MNTSLDPIIYLSPEISCCILSQLPPKKDLIRCRQVSKTWNVFINNSPPFKAFFKNIWSHFKVKSKEEFLERFPEIAKRIVAHGKGDFILTFPFNPGCIIRTKFDSGEEWAHGENSCSGRWALLKEIRTDEQDFQTLFSEKTSYVELHGLLGDYTGRVKISYRSASPSTTGLELMRISDQIENMMIEQCHAESKSMKEFSQLIHRIACLCGVIFLFYFSTNSIFD
jgi:hypothetical protein